MWDVGGLHQGFAVRPVPLHEARRVGHRPLSGEGNRGMSRRKDHRRERGGGGNDVSREFAEGMNQNGWLPLGASRHQSEGEVERYFFSRRPAKPTRTSPDPSNRIVPGSGTRAGAKAPPTR